MKIFALAALALALSACNDNDTSPAPAEGNSDYGRLELFTDYANGCQYVGWQWHALSPRLGPDGKQICRDELKRKP